MGLTMTQKILAAHAGRNAVRPGDLIEADVDLVLGNDITAPPAIREFRRAGTRVFDPERIALVPDHFAPNKDIASAEQCRLMREFAREQGIVHYFEVGRMGVEHALLPEQGLVGPGDLVVGADSHTCTYGALGAFAAGVGSTDMAAAMLIGRCWFKVPAAIRIDLTGALSGWASGKDVILDIIGRLGVDGARYQSLEFNGPGLRSLSLESRLTAANMAVEAGAKNGIFPVDEITVEYLRGRLRRPGRVYEADGDAEYERVLDFDLSSLRPLVACPHLPENVKPAAEIGTVPVDQVVIGSCTNGRIEDLRVAADVLRGRTIDPRVRLLVVPATPNIYLQALEEGLLTVFIRAGGAVSTPTCGPCLGGHMGVLAAGERAVATTNRNFVGRMGHPASEVYLAGPAVAAASAVAGRIVDPVEVCGADVPVEAGSPPAPAAGRAR